MVGDHHTSERVYAQLKVDVLGSSRSSDRLNINTLAQRYDASTTPVREALLRLVGEGLVEMPAAGGFVLPSIDIKVAHDGYSFALGLALMAAGNADPAWSTLPPDMGSSRLRVPIDALLINLAERTGNAALVSAVASSNDFMHPIRRMEEKRLSNLEAEIDRIRHGLDNKVGGKMKSYLTTYSRRRLRNLGKILAFSA